MPTDERLVKSKQRVSDHGEVFTPSHIVNAMLNLVKEESERIDSRFLEPACGEGNFLKEVLSRKLATVQTKYGKNEFERRHYALLALMCIYGIEILEDNAQLCRSSLAEIFEKFIGDKDADQWKKAASTVLAVNIVHADALTMKTPKGESLVFPEWGYLGRGRYQRRDFKYDNLAQRSSFKGTLFDGLEMDEIFKPVANFNPMTVRDIAELGENDV
ncbi:N-6 DNA methylase [Varibaculum cambriense]|uniref:N-6 DNA methylase n=1 Tax=Varibaculum cambriense TaxID=184870 RepID=UPI002900EB87|nr:N-6 DNA methylase [Varibaculum cambriense]MDU1224344.1 N-6 DNA methylase [Varibaculum cambriense]